MSERTALYRLFSAVGQLFYVGISENPPHRWGQHAADKAWWPDVATLTLCWYETRELAEAAEEAAISAELPVHNLIVRMGAEWVQLGIAAGPRRRAAVLRQMLRWYLSYPGATLPDRPPRISEVARQAGADE